MSFSGSGEPSTNGRTNTRIADLKAHPRNYNVHPKAQVEKIGRSLARFGQRKPITTWRGMVLTGHGVFEAARALGWTEIWAEPCPEEWTEAEALAWLTADNELGRGADPDEDALAAIVVELGDVDAELAALAAGTDERLRELMAGLADAASPSGGEEDEEAELGRWDVPDAVFATDNDLGVPLLDIEMQALSVVAPVQPWGMGAGARSRQNRGTWHFYTEDYRFEALWTNPAPVVNSGCVAVVEPNFSAFLEMPRAVALWQIYRKRWLARWWQTMGIRVFVDLNVAEVHYEDNMLGVPSGWTAWATHGYTERLHLTDVEFEMACERAGTKAITFLVYGGGKAVKARCQERGWIHIIEQRDAAKETNDG